MKITSWPVYFADLLRVGNLASNVGIATLWTEKNLILGGLDAKTYAVGGQLYSFSGINHIIRNTLANPKIKHLLICGADRSKSGQAILSLKEHGIDENHRIINYPDAKIEKEIPAEAIELFRTNVQVIDLRDQTDAAAIQEIINGLDKDASPFAEAQLFPETVVPKPDIFPSEEANVIVSSKTIAEAWVEILEKVMRFGHLKQSEHFSDQRELVNLIAVVEEDLANIFWPDYLPMTKEELENYYPQVLTAAPFPSISYTYGQRLRNHEGIDQIQAMIDYLKETPFTRRAVGVTWNVKTDCRDDSPPCLDLVQSLIQGNKLFFTAYFRSNDMFRAWPQNVFALRKLQKMVADGAGVELGPLTTISCSAHIYADCFEPAQEIIAEHGKKVRCRWDPRGNYIISLANGKIKAQLNSPSGIPLTEFWGRSAAEVLHEVARHHSISDTMHAMDLGAQLQNAEIALNLGIEFKQDNPLQFPVVLKKAKTATC